MPVDALRPGCDFGQHTFGVFHGLEFAFLLHGFGAGVEEALSDEYPGASFSGGTRLTALMLTKPAFDICGMADVNPSAGFRLEYVDMNHDAPAKARRRCLLQKQTPPSVMSGWRDLNPRPLRPERSARL